VTRPTAYGIDFGTTNSSIAACVDGQVEVLRVEPGAEPRRSSARSRSSTAMVIAGRAGTRRDATSSPQGYGIRLQRLRPS